MGRPKKKDYNIYPINIDDSKKNESEDKYPLSNAVHLHIIVGRVKSGKSVLLNNLYLSERLYGDDFETKILVSSTAYNDAINKFMIDEFDFVFSEYSDELMDEIVDMIEKDEGTGRFLVILDDIIDSDAFTRGKTNRIDKLVSRYRHIGNDEVEGKLAIAIATQYFKSISSITRNNATAYYIMGILPEMELKKKSEELIYFGGSDRAFLNIYKKSRKEAYDFLYLSVEHLEARRNHDEILWSEKDSKDTDSGENADDEDSEESIEKKISSNDI